MTKVEDRGRLDWLVELAGAAFPALAAGYSALALAPLLGWPMPESLLASAGGTFALAFIVIRAVPPEPRQLALPVFDPADITEDALLLDQRYDPSAELLLDQPLVEAAADAVAELLLEDVLPAPAPDSRVVQLFADGRMPTAGQLQQRIERHLADGGRPAEAGDASDALSEALAELRRSLRQG